MDHQPFISCYERNLVHHHHNNLESQKNVHNQAWLGNSWSASNLFIVAAHYMFIIIFYGNLFTIVAARLYYFFMKLMEANTNFFASDSLKLEIYFQITFLTISHFLLAAAIFVGAGFEITFDH